MSSRSDCSAFSVAFINVDLYQFSDYWYIWSILAMSTNVKKRMEDFLANSMYLFLSILIWSSLCLATSWSFLILVASDLVFYNLLIRSSSFNIVSGSELCKSANISSSLSFSIFSFLALVSIKLFLSCSRSYFSNDTTKDSI
jgi:hypothetical protein